MKYKRSKASTEERRAKIKTQLAEFDKTLDDETRAYITARWSGYSPRNALLITMQCPTATDVAGFVAWRERGRTVRKGEAGIMILAPAGHGDDVTDVETGEVTEKGRQYFKAAYVFDVAQTDLLSERVAA